MYLIPYVLSRGKTFANFEVRAIHKSFLQEILGHAAPTYVWFQESFLHEILTSYGSAKVFSLESLLLYGIYIFFSFVHMYLLIRHLGWFPQGFVEDKTTVCEFSCIIIIFLTLCTCTRTRVFQITTREQVHVLGW